jgi:DNA-binding GntR family transcriptional regulator
MARKRTLQLPPTSQSPLGETVFQVLRQAMQDGFYQAGDRLREEEIARELEVSRTPVREALGRLQAKRFVESLGAKGLVVRALDLTEVMELYSMREILESAAARLAAQQISAAELGMLRDLASDFDAQREDPVEMARINRRFHDAIVNAARNRYLRLMLEDLQDGISLLGTTTFGVPERVGTASVEHLAIIEALARHDADGSAKLAAEHIRGALRVRLRLLQTRQEVSERAARAERGG